METTIDIGVMLGLYWGYRSYIGIMEKKMETTIISSGVGYQVQGEEKAGAARYLV